MSRKGGGSVLDIDVAILTALHEELGRVLAHGENWEPVGYGHLRFQNS